MVRSRKPSFMRTVFPRSSLDVVALELDEGLRALSWHLCLSSWPSPPGLQGDCSSFRQHIPAKWCPKAGTESGLRGGQDNKWTLCLDLFSLQGAKSFPEIHLPSRFSLCLSHQSLLWIHSLNNLEKGSVFINLSLNQLWFMAWNWAYFQAS